MGTRKLSTFEEQAERDGERLRFRDQQAQNLANRSRSYEQWAHYARESMASASQRAAEVIAKGLPAEQKAWDMMGMARRQVEESRAERLAALDPNAIVDAEIVG